MATALSSWMHVSICGILFPRSFTRLSCSPRKLAPGTSATYGSSSRCSMRAIASLPHTSVRDDDGVGVSGTMGGTGLLGVIDSPPRVCGRRQAYPRREASGKAATWSGYFVRPQVLLLGRGGFDPRGIWRIDLIERERVNGGQFV